MAMADDADCNLNAKLQGFRYRTKDRKAVLATEDSTGSRLVGFQEEQRQACHG